ncbi:MAG: dTMP kinase [Alphaproteobacteria bacterium]|nr:dTMP kinase [Alphaproteobacteria bacterium]MBU0858697.1 dTMP kinase [Alphaproteobacteria bacterium]
MPASGLFITLEGGEGTGKTTQINALADSLRAQGREVVTTREPGGTPEAEKIRTLLVHREGGNWTPMAECLLLFAGRQMHVETLIKPALARGAVVISDRFADSTRAYQGYGHGLALDVIENINRLTLGDFRPDLTFVFDMKVEDGLKRSGRRLAAEESAEDRFEQLDIAFHERMRQGYLSIAGNEPQRCVIVDATGSTEEIATQLMREVSQRL